MYFCTVFFSGRAPSALVNAAADQEFERLVGNREIEIALAKPGQFLGIVSEPISR
jgi:hypothetical protein